MFEGVIPSSFSRLGNFKDFGFKLLKILLMPYRKMILEWQNSSLNLFARDHRYKFFGNFETFAFDHFCLVWNKL